MNNKIVIIGINYYPEDSAIGLYTTQKAEYLASNGFDVSVITGFPYYPQWEIRNEYKSKGYLITETINGVKVLRNKQYVPKNPTFLKRIVHLISFTIGSFVNLFKVDKPDIVISIIPFTTSSMLGWFLKKWYKCKHWVHIQDFEFDAAIDSGLLNGNKKMFISFLQKIEKLVLNKADLISTISYGMLNKLKTKTDKQTYYLTNWVDLGEYDKNTLIEHSYLDSTSFKILYSGNIGAKQDWSFFVNVLNHLKEVENIEVIVVGEGAEKQRLIDNIKGFDFVKHYNLVPYEELSSLLRSADMHILFQKVDVVDTVMPSKILGMMASEKPSVVTGNLKSEVAKVFKDSKAGFYYDGASVNEVVQKIKFLKQNKEICSELGMNAKTYVQENYSKTIVLNNFINKLDNLIKV